MPSEKGDKHRESSAKISREISAGARDIGKVPACKNPKRRKSCERNFRRFCETYFGSTFALDWSPDHLTVIGQIETSILEGGLFATAMPRGSGKTSLAEVAALFAILYGHRRFVVSIGADKDGALQVLDSIKVELESSEILADDFPEVCFPIAALEGIAHRCNGQTSEGERTHIGWGADEVVLPTIKGSKASGTILRVAGITGKIRGMKFKTSEGRAVRPDLVIVDDPQTDESAFSASQCVTRERILAGAILGLAGPTKKISGIMPCTVIRPGDLADRILNREIHPEWNGTRTKMVYSFPKNEKLWDQYARIRAESLQSGRGGKEATEFYRENRKAMDEGSKVAWEQRFNADELSALQHAMNLKILDERAFFAEYQNEPKPEEEARGDDLHPDQISAKVNRLPRGCVPITASRVTSFIDVQGTLLFYAVVAWEDNFTGYILDYGTWPDQKRAYFSLRDAKVTFPKVLKGTGLEGQIYGALEALTDQLLGRAWEREDGADLLVERCLIDAAWGQSTPIVKKFCRQSKHANILMPFIGKYVGASSVPMGEYTKQPGDKVGMNWRIPKAKDRGEVRHVLGDTNFWKSFVHARLSTAMGDRGCLSIFGENPQDHRLFADHMVSEYRIRTTGRGREVDEWKMKPSRPDNHWLDCVSGSAIAASIQGCVVGEIQAIPEAKPKRVSFAEMQRRKRA